MKKLITILSSFVLVFVFSFEAISCKSAKKSETDENINRHTFSDEEKIINQIEITLSDGIDASKFNTKNTMADVLSLVTYTISKIASAAGNIRFAEENKAGNYLSEGNNNFEIFLDINGKTKTFSVLIKNVKNELSITMYNVPGDGNCLFWSVATSYLLSVRNNINEIKVRFQSLFGTDQLLKLSHVQKLLEQYNLQDTSTNQAFFQDPIVKELVAKVFRNKVVDYIETIIKTDHNGDKDIFINAIKQDIYENTKVWHDDLDTNDYLQKMRVESTWGGNPEMLAMCNILKTYITIVNTKTKLEPYNKVGVKNTIELYYSGNHYNFYLTEKND